MVGALGKTVRSATIAIDVIVLNVEPGAYALSARLIKGLPGSLKYLSAWPAMKSFGSKLGFDAIATSEPVRASSTTTAPALAE